MNEREQRMVEMFNSGTTYADLARAHGISRQRVHQLIGREVDRNQHRQARIKERAERLAIAHKRYMANESTLEEEAEQEGIKVSSLISAFYEFGLSIRKQLPSPEHGTSYRYSRGCRCSACKRASQEKYRERKQRGPSVHGTESAYANFGCRCDECRLAGAEANRRHRRARLEREAAKAAARLPDD